MASQDIHGRFGPQRRIVGGLLQLLVFSAVASGQPCFLPAVDVDISGGPRALETADFNGDGRPDIVVSLAETPDPATDEVAVMLGTGTGSFGPPTRYPVGINPASVVVLDFNRDGRLDLAVANGNELGTPPTTPDITFLAGDGTGGFSQAGNASVGGRAFDLAVADFNADSFQDLVVALYQPPGTAILLGNGAGGFSNAVFHAAFSNVAAVDVGDFNRDGRVDFVATQDFQGAEVWVYLGNGAGGFDSGTSHVAAIIPVDVLARDFNGDGLLDLAVSTISFLATLLATPTGFAPPVLHSVGPTPRGVTAFDVEGDGDLDLAIVTGGGTVAVLLGDGAGSFGPPFSFPVGSRPWAVISADFNLDGVPDLISTNYDSNDLSILLQSPLGISPSTVPVSVVGIPFPTTTFVASGGTAPLTLTLTGALPPGLFFNPSTGTLSGTPTQAGSFSFSVTAQDALGCVRVQTYGLLIAAAIPTLAGWGLVLLSVALAGVGVLCLRRSG